MKNKTLLVVSFVALCAISLPSIADVGCGNSQQGGVSTPSGGTGGNNAPTSDPAPPPNHTDDGDPVNVYTANDHRATTDIVVSGAVGEHELAFTRFTNSRFVGASQPFGAGSSVRHNYQWDMADYTADPSTGAARLQVTYPNGTQNVFTKVGASQWLSSPGVPDVINQTGSLYTLQTKSGWQYDFSKITIGSQYYYQMFEFLDSMQNVYSLDYDSSNRVIKVMEPAGRSISILYGSTGTVGVFEKTMATVASAPGAGVAVQMTFATPLAYRYLRFIAAGTVEVAELQFLDKFGNAIPGAIFSTPSTSSSTAASNVNDGSATTYFESSDSSKGYVGLDQGSGPIVAVAGFRIVARGGYESSLLNGRIVADNLTPNSVSVISQVVASDGRVVNYNYSQVANGGVATTFSVLSSVGYPDGTTGTYGYVQTVHDTRPLLQDVYDPKYELAFGQIHMDYYKSILGAVEKQVDPLGQTMIQIGLNGGNLHQPTSTLPTVQGGVVTRQFNMANGLLHIKYDGLGRQTAFTAASGGLGFVTSIRDGLWHTTQFIPSNMANPLSVILPDNSQINYTRDSLDLPLSIKDERSNTKFIQRDGSHRIEQLIYPDSTTEHFIYNSYGQVTSHQLRSGATETAAYDSRGLMTSRTDACGATTTFLYDTMDRQSTATDARGNATNYTYDARGLLTLVTNADGSSCAFVYDDFENKVSETNELGATWTYTYDHFKRVVTSTDPLGSMITYTYGGGYSKLPIASTTSGGIKTGFNYDGEGQLVSTTVGVGTSDAATTSYIYDVAGNLIQKTDPSGGIWTLTYDNRDRKTSETDPSGNKTQFLYDKAGNVIRLTRPDGSVTVSTYDSLNRILTVADAKGQTTAYTYDANGNVLTMKDAKGATHTYAYDLCSRHIGTTYPDGSTEATAYDLVGNVIAFTTRAGKTKTSVYDNRDREVSYTWSDGTLGTVKTFDFAGRVLTSGNGTCLSTYTYDASNHCLSETQANTASGFAWAVDYAYDVDGRRGLLLYPSGLSVGYGYTGRNQINGISGGGLIVGAYTYDLNGNIASRSLSNGVVSTYAYDASNRLQSLNHAVGLISIGKFEYGYDVLNRRKFEQRDSLRGDVFTYDQIDQLTAVSYDALNPGGAATLPLRVVGYSHDANGNRSSVIDSLNSTLSYSTNNMNQYTSAGLTALSYDANGNLSGGLGAFSYDAQNRLLSATVGGNVITYTYDSQNRVMVRTVNGVSSYLIYDGWDLIQEHDATGALTAVFVHGVRQDELLVRISSTGVIYFNQNALGSVISLTDASGLVLERYKYDVFGRPSISDAAGNSLTSSALNNRFLFTAREWQAEVGLYDYRNRFYSPDLGRFIQPDPIRFNAGDVNIYRYCSNEPINSTDALGLSGTLTISSQGSSGLGTHSWVTYTPDSTGVPTTYGTWARPDQGKEGLVENGESGRNPTASRTTHLNDEQEAAFNKSISDAKAKGKDAWSYGAPCSTFAANTWNTATGESLSPQMGPISNPASLTKSILKANGGNNSDNATTNGKPASSAASSSSPFHSSSSASGRSLVTPSGRSVHAMKSI